MKNETMRGSELDRWRVAQQLMETHKSGAVAECGRRASQSIKQGDFKDFYRWQDIALKIHELQQQFVSGKTIH